MDVANYIEMEFRTTDWEVLPAILHVSGELYQEACRQREARKLWNVQPSAKRKRAVAGKLQKDRFLLGLEGKLSAVGDNR